MQEPKLLALLWRLRLALGFLGFLAAVSLFATLMIGNSTLFALAFLMIWYTLMAVIGIELLGCLILILLFIGRKAGLLRHLT
jgi:hypothetical protein